MDRDILWSDGPDLINNTGGGGNSHDPALLADLLQDIELDDDEDVDLLDGTGQESRIGTVQRKGQECLPVEEVKSNDLCSSSLLSLAVRAWQRFAVTKTARLNQQLFLEYLTALQAFFGEDRVPPDIAFIFECILGHNKAESPSSIQLKSYKSPEVVTVNLSRSSWMESQSTKQMRKLLVATLEVLNAIVDVTVRLKGKMELQGCLNLTTPEHALCQTSCYVMCSFLNKLEVVHTLLQKYQSSSSNLYEPITSGIKSSRGYWLNEVKELSDKDILFSVVSNMEVLYITTYEYMLLVTAGLCWNWQMAALTDTKPCKLIGIVSDFIISVRDARDSIRSGLNIYDSLQASGKSTTNKESASLPSFSRENKIKRHWNNVGTWNENFSAHTESVKQTCSSLAAMSEEQNGDPEQYKKMVDELKQSLEVSLQYSQELTKLLNTQVAMVGDLSSRVTPSPHRLPELEPVMDSIRVTSASPLEEGQNGRDLAQPSEFGNCDGVDAVVGGDLNDIASADEVFVGLFSDLPGVDDIQPQNQVRSNQEEQLVQELYSGVVHQLKSALVPVKSKMKLREKEAVTKLYGNVPLAVDDKDEEEIENGTQEASKAFDISCRGDAHYHIDFGGRDPRKQKKGKRRTLEDYEEDSTLSTNTTFFDGDFMKELKFKLNRTTAQDEELVCEPSSEEISEVESH